MIISKLYGKYINLSLPIKATLWFIIANILQQGMNVLTTPIFTRILSESDYGIVSIYNSWFGILLIIFTLNLSYGVFNNGLIDFKEDRESFTSSLVGLTIILVIIWGIVFISNKQLMIQVTGLSGELILLMILSILFNAIISFWMAKEKFQYKYQLCIIINIVMVIARVCLSLYLVISNDSDKYFYKILGDALPTFIVGFILMIYILLRGRSVINISYWKYALSFNVVLIPHYLANNILSTSDRIMISKYCGMEKAAIYSIAYSCATLITIIFSAINASWIPFTYRALKDENYILIRKNTNILNIFLSGMCIIFIAIAPELIKIFAPPTYYEAIYVIPPVIVGLYFSHLHSLFANVEFYYKKNKFVAIASVIAAFLNIILNIMFIPKIGYIAAAYTTLIGYLFLAIAHYIFMKKKCSDLMYDKKIIIFTALTIILGAMLMLILYNKPYIRFGVIFIILIMAIKDINKIKSKIFENNF